MAFSWSELSGLLEEQLQRQPGASAFAEAPPADIPRLDVTMPSGCSMWRRAETEVFFAAAEDHPIRHYHAHQIVGRRIAASHL